MKKSVTKQPSLFKQLFWFGLLYIASIIAIGLFHEFGKWLINFLKDMGSR